MNQAEELLRVIVRRAVEAESIPVPTIWKERIVELCVRVVHKLIGCDRAVVALCAEFVQGQTPTNVRCAACDKPAVRDAAGLYPTCPCGGKQFNGTIRS